ncbi:MAG: inorganic diphosphatase [Aureliella sp.]
MAAESDSEEEVVEVVVETPRDGRNKFKFDERSGQFRLGSVLPAGMSFPYDFGFIPDTRAEDGDPLDVLLLMDEPAFPGCRVDARLVGVIEAEQSEGDQMVRNDRLIAVAVAAHNYRDLRSLKDINANLLKEIERFFIAYNETRGKRFRVLGAYGPKRAMALLERAKK